MCDCERRGVRVLVDGWDESIKPTVPELKKWAPEKKEMSGIENDKADCRYDTLGKLLVRNLIPLTETNRTFRQTRVVQDIDFVLCVLRLAEIIFRTINVDC